MSPYASYKMDRDKEKSGVVIVENEFFRITGARAGGKNVAYEDLREALTKPHRRAIQTGTLPKELQDRLNAELAAGALVKLWETNENAGTPGAAPKWKPNTIHDPVSGKVEKITPELIVATFLQFDELYDQFSRGCVDVENFLDKEAIEADVKN
jgi:hypothetical protein